MKALLKSFWKEKDGGADQLIILAILIVVGIGIALLFGDQIKAMVENLLKGAIDDTSNINSDSYRTPSGN